MLVPRTGIPQQPNNGGVSILAPYHPLTWQVAPWRDRSRVLLLTGSAGGGKSRLAAEKLHGFCLHYPGAFALLVRKTRVSMTKGSILFLKESVIGSDPRVAHYESKDYFRYWNGSILAYLGLEDEAQRERLKSIGPRGGVDIAWGEEATELEESDHNALLARLRGQAAPWRQLLYTCNPDAPTHWIHRRLIQGREARAYYSKATDNAYNPDDYMDTLGRLTGTERDRLLLGQWVQASGLVYDVWSDGPDDGNVTEAAERIPNHGQFVLAIDDGYAGKRDDATGHFTPDSHPRAVLLCQIRDDGRVCIFDEDYRVQTLSDQHIESVLQTYGEPDYAVVDSAAAELRGRLRAYGIGTYGKPSDIEESIKITRRMLAPDLNGWRRILVHPRCRHLRAEMVSYRYDDKGRPLKQFDHGCDALRYLAFKLRHE